MSNHSAPGSRVSARSRNHHAAHREDDVQAAIPDLPLVHRGEAALVADAAGLQQLLGVLRADGCFAYDTEFISEESYFSRTCLVQVASRSTLALIDPLATEGGQPLDLAPFWSLVADPSVIKIVHAGDSDVEPVVRHLGCAPANIFDTQIAAAFLGLPYPVSLKKLVAEMTGAPMGKDMGFSDWRARPLSAAQRRYAADDVRYLPAAHREMTTRLDALGHTRWAAEECAAACAMERFRPDPGSAWQRVRGSNTLPPRGLAVLRELAAWRDGAARAADRPPRAFLKDEVLVDLAREQPASPEALAKVRSLSRSLAESAGTLIVEAVQRGRNLPRGEQPAQEPELSAADKFRTDALFAVLQCLCAGSLLDQGLVASRKELERFFRHVVQHEGPPPAMMNGWRREAAGDALTAFLEGRSSITLRWKDGVLEAARQPV